MNNAGEKIIATLNHLTSIAEDGKNGYEKAAQNADDVNMKDLFLRFGHQRTAYSQELRALIKNMGGIAGSYNGIAGSIHRGWIDIKSAVLPENTSAIIYSCAVGEAAAIRAYTEALNSEYITGNIRSVISGQLSGIHAALKIITTYGWVAVV